MPPSSSARASKVSTDYISRALGVYMGIFGNVPQVSVYLSMPTDADGKPLDGSKTSYTLTFAKGQVPPVKYFWSITMYSIPQRLLVENPIKRYSIGSSTPGLKYNDDGSLTIYVSATSPAKTRRATGCPRRAARSGPCCETTDRTRKSSAANTKNRSTWPNRTK